MKERLKEWLLRKLVRDLMQRRYGVHLMTIVLEESLDEYYEDGLYTVHCILSDHLELAKEKVRIKGDPLL